jgi:hypothetical protein
VRVAERDVDDAPAEWRATNDTPRAGRSFGVGVFIVGLPALIVLFAGGIGTAFGVVFMLTFLAIGVVVGGIDWWRIRRSAVAIRVEGPAERPEFVVERVDGRVLRFPVATVQRLHVTHREDLDDYLHTSTLSMRISVPGRVIRTRPGPADTARTVLAMCEEAGARMTSHTVVPD